MYTMLWVPGVLAALLTVLYFAFLKKKLSMWVLAVGYILLLGAVITVLTNKEVSIEQPRYGIAVFLSLAGLLFPLIAYVKKNDTLP